MADTYLPAEPLSDGDDGDEVDPAASRYVELIGRLEVGARILRVLSYVTAILWVIVVISGVSIYWDQLTTLSASGPITSRLADTDRLAQVIVSVSLSTWGYLAVTVVAYTASLLVDSRRLPALREAVDDDEDEPAAD